MTTASTIQALMTLGKAPFELQLTGSRFFGTAIEGSDFDFFAQYSKETCDWLSEHGFRRTASQSYRDASLYCVFELNEVQVQLVESFQVKNLIQNVLLDSHIASFPKLSFAAWDAFYWVYQQGYNQGYNQARNGVEDPDEDGLC